MKIVIQIFLIDDEHVPKFIIYCRNGLRSEASGIRNSSSRVFMRPLQPVIM